MSKIAAALAKAKERTGTTTAPFLVGTPGGGGLLPPASGEKEALLRKARRTQRFWLILTSVVAVITTFLIWQRLTPDKSRATAVASSPPPLSAPASEPAAPAHAPLALPPPKNDPAGTTPAPARVVPPNAELYRTVNALVISAVLPGDQPRLMHKGRIVQIGDTVEGELVFAGIQDDQLVFNDRRGAIYVRRY